MPIKLMVLDVDGTLADEKGSVSPENAAAVRAAMETGVRVALATGRPLQGVEGLCRRLGINGPLILTNGSLVLSGGSLTLSGDEVWLEEYLSPEDLALIYQHAVNRGGLALFAFLPELVYYWLPPNVDRNHILDISDAFSLKLRREVETPDELPLQHINKVMCVGSTEAVAKLLNTWPAALAHIARGRSLPHVGEINSTGANKGRALAAVCEHLGLTPDEVLTVGDGETDIPMLKYAGSAVYISRGAHTHALPPHVLVVTKNHDRAVSLAVSRYISDRKP